MSSVHGSLSLVLHVRSLRSAVTDRLVVLSVRLHTVDNRAFSVAAPKIWNSLTDDVVSSASRDNLLPPTDDFFV